MTQMQGYLKKKSPRNQGKTVVDHWQKRYFVIEGSRVRYYQQQPGTKAGESGSDEKGVIELRGAKMNVGSPPTHFDVLDSAGRMWHLQAQTLTESEGWVRALREAGVPPSAPSSGPMPTVQSFAERPSAPLVGRDRAASDRAPSNRPRVESAQGSRRVERCWPLPSATRAPRWR